MSTPSSSDLLSTMTAADLKSLSDRLGLTVGATARGLGVSPSQYNKYLYGGHAVPQTVALAATALLLGATGYEPDLAVPRPAVDPGVLPAPQEASDPYLSFVMTVD
jgi:hypothetical protein